MATLSWSWNEYQVPNGIDIENVKQALGSALQQKGFRDVAVGGDVHGDLPGIDLFAAVTFLLIGGSKFWQVVAVGGDGTVQQAQAEVAEINQIIASLRFL